MSKRFDLLLLHTASDTHPRSWICFGGKGISEVILKLENKIKSENNLCREKISKIVSAKLKCHKMLIKHLLQGKREFYPIPVILGLLELCKGSTSCLQEILNYTTYLKVNSASAKPIRAVNKLTKELCKLFGAFAADGSLSYQIVVATNKSSEIGEIVKNLLDYKIIRFSESYSKSRKEFFVSFNADRNNLKTVEQLIFNLSSKYKIQTHTHVELSDEHRSSVEAFKNWVDISFELKPTFFEKKKNSWRVNFSNKILGRYLTAFFDVKPGYKTDIIGEPQIIKSSPLAYRKAFARGVLMFDGTATMAGKIILESKSKALADAIADIFKKDELNFGRSVSRGNHVIYTYKNNNKNKLLDYFESNTWKEVRLKEALQPVSYTTFQIYKKYSFNKITIESLLEGLRRVGVCDVAYLMNMFKCRHTTVMTYLKVLENRGIVSLSRYPKNLNVDSISGKATIFLERDAHKLLFNKLKKKYRRYDLAAKYFDLQKGTLSAWKMGKNRIPFWILKQFCNDLGVGFNELLVGNIEVDRKIVELI